MNKQAAEVCATFDAMGAEYQRFSHPPVPTATARFDMGLDFNAQVCKNLLVTTRNESRFLLLMLPAEKDADLKALRAAVGSTRLGFAGEGPLMRLLGQTPGSVGVCGIINDTARLVEVVFDVSLRGLPRVAAHPGDNTQTIVTAFENFESYVHRHGNKIIYFDF